MATSLGIKTEDKVILGALAGAARFKGLRLFFSRITSALTTGQVKDFGSVVQKLASIKSSLCLNLFKFLIHLESIRSKNHWQNLIFG